MVVAGEWRLVVSQTLATFPTRASSDLHTWWESWNEQDGNTYFILLYLSTFQITSRTFTMHSISPPATMMVSLDTPINKRWCSGDHWQHGWRLFVGQCCFPLFSCIFFSVPWYLRHGQYPDEPPKIARVCLEIRYPIPSHVFSSFSLLSGILFWHVLAISYFCRHTQISLVYLSLSRFFLVKSPFYLVQSTFYRLKSMPSCRPGIIGWDSPSSPWTWRTSPRSPAGHCASRVPCCLEASP